MQDRSTLESRCWSTPGSPISLVPSMIRASLAFSGRRRARRHWRKKAIWSWGLDRDLVVRLRGRLDMGGASGLGGEVLVGDPLAEEEQSAQEDQHGHALNGEGLGQRELASGEADGD